MSFSLGKLADADNWLVSFSGGRTSAYMTKRLAEIAKGRKNLKVVFANTGEEHEETLKFVSRCEEFFGVDVTWLEAQVDERAGEGTKHKTVDFLSAARPNATDGPFEQVVKKYGIPNKSYPSCTRELKERPIWSYIRSLGWPKTDFAVPVGIRADEADRVSVVSRERNIVYPLVAWGIRKEDVLSFWRQQKFDLYVPEHLGNCCWCWKKSLRKHITLAIDTPHVFDAPQRFERLYGFAGPGAKNDPRRFFRQKMSVADIFAEAGKTKLALFRDPNFVADPALDVAGDCSESCEAFADGGQMGSV
jgi:3'-phosphoadenosine 5'-phosphosulfate sulfotransferase (PAPS reductase)/FAD synthetase